MLKVRLPYASRLAKGSKRHEMRSRSISYFDVSPGDWVWFCTLKGKLEGFTGCAVLGGAYFVRESAPLQPGVAADEALWTTLAHTVPQSLTAFAQSMGGGYKNGVYAWEFDRAVELERPVDMADDPSITFARFAPRAFYMVDESIDQ